MSRDMILEAARRIGRRKKGLPLHSTPDEIAAEEREKDDRLEREIQAECADLYRASGCFVYSLSQKRASKQTPGIADLLVFPRHGLSFWMEVKTPTGRQSPDQVVFQEMCEGTGTTYVLGGVAAARAQIATLQSRDLSEKSPPFSDKP